MDVAKGLIDLLYKVIRYDGDICNLYFLNIFSKLLSSNDKRKMFNTAIFQLLKCCRREYFLLYFKTNISNSIIKNRNLSKIMLCSIG